jgi:hypothetical protein
MGRDKEGERIASTSGLVGISCIHFGGDGDVSWGTDVDKGSRQGATGDVVEVKANGGDMYYSLYLIISISNRCLASCVWLG